MLTSNYRKKKTKQLLIIIGYILKKSNTNDDNGNAKVANHGGDLGRIRNLIKILLGILELCHDKLLVKIVFKRK